MTISTRTTTLTLVLCLAIAGATPLFAQSAAPEPHAMHGMKMDGPMMKGNAPVNEAAKAFAAANTKMHADMTMEFTGDADVDFMKGMIPHHQGAIDMAQIVLKYGKDAEVRKLAQDVIKAQEGEIAFMKNWLAKHPK